MSFTSHIHQEKNEYRAKYKELRKNLSEEEKAGRDRAIVKYALSLASFRFADYVLMYAATEDEINIDEVGKTAIELGKKVAFPRCDKDNFSMTYHIVSSLEDLQVESYNIREPSGELPVYDPQISGGNAVCFVPGLLFDKKGYRLGYGKGFYDRYLSSFNGNKIGVIYSDFILDSVPIGRFDTKVDILLTEKNIKVVTR